MKVGCGMFALTYQKPILSRVHLLVRLSGAWFISVNCLLVNGSRCKGSLVVEVELRFDKFDSPWVPGNNGELQIPQAVILYAKCSEPTSYL